MAIHPNSLKNLKPIQKGQKNHPMLNKQKALVDRFHNYMGDLPEGVYPWELIQDAITEEGCPLTEKIKGATILGNWIIKDTPVNIEVNAETAIIDNTEQRIRELLKTQDELDAEAELQEELESSGNEEQYEENE